MSRVEKELASLAPWAWDPLVVRHAPGSAMMRDFSEVVADKTVTGGNARARTGSSPRTPRRPRRGPRIARPRPPRRPPRRTPERRSGALARRRREKISRLSSPEPTTEASASGRGRARRRPRAPPSTTPPRRPRPPRAVPPSRPRAPAASSARATPFGTGRAASRLASAAQPTRGPQRLNDGGGAPNHRGRGAGNDGNDAAPVANLVKALDEAGDEEPRRKRRRGDAKTPAKKREEEEREAPRLPRRPRRPRKPRRPRMRRRPRQPDAAAEAKRAAAAAKRKAQREERERERAAERAEKENRRPDGEDAAAALPERKEPHVRSRELASLDPMSGPDARRQREAALLAVAAVEAAAEAEAAKPKASQAQTLLAAFYDLTGREPPPGWCSRTPPRPRPRWSGPSGRRTRATWRCTARCTSLRRRRPRARGLRRATGLHRAFGGAGSREDSRQGVPRRARASRLRGCGAREGVRVPRAGGRGGRGEAGGERGRGAERRGASEEESTLRWGGAG